MAISETVEININSNQAVASLRSIERNLDLLTNGFREFMTGVAEGMTSALGKTNQTTAGLDRMRKSVDDLNKSVDKTAIAKKLGSDVARSNQAIGQLGSTITQTGRQLLGLESIIGAFAVTQLVRGANEYARANQGVSESNFNSVRAQEAMSRNMANLQQAVLNIIEPLNKLVANTEISIKTFERFIIILTALGGAFLAFKALGGLRSLIGSFLEKIEGAQTPMAVLRAMFKDVKYEFLILGDAFKRGVDPVARLIAFFTGLLSIILRFAGIIGIIIGVAQAINLLVKAFTGFDIIDWVSTQWEKLTLSVKKYDEAIRSAIPFHLRLLELLGKMSLPNNTSGPTGRIYGEDSQKAYERIANTMLAMRLEIDDATLSFERQNQAIIQNLQLENRLIGVSNEAADIERLRLRYLQDRVTLQDDFNKKIRDLTPDQAAGGGRAMLEAQLATFIKISKTTEAAQIAQLIEEWEKKRANIRAQLGNQIADDLQNFQRQNQNIQQQLNLETRLFGQSQDSLEIARIRQQFEQQRLQTITDLQRKIRDLGAEETAAGGVQMIQDQIASYRQLSTAAEQAQIRELKALQKKRAEQAAFNAQMEYTVEMSNQQIQRTQTLANILQGLRGQQQEQVFERSQIDRSPFERQVAEAYERARRSTIDAQRQFAEAFADTGDGMTPDRMTELQRGLDAIAEGFQRIAYETENNLLISQQWKTGWEDAFRVFSDEALNAADRARTLFNSIISSMESTLDNFVRTGKLNFKDLVRSIIADLTSMALKNAFRQLLLASSAGRGGSLLSTLGSFFAGFFADGGFIPPGKAGIVGEAGPELVSGPARVTPMAAAGGVVNNYYNYNISALDARSVAQLFSENRRTLLGVTEQARKEMPIRQRF